MEYYATMTMNELQVYPTTWMNLENTKPIKQTAKNIYGMVQFRSVAQSRPTLWDPMDCSMPGLPLHHQLPEFTQTHVHWVGAAIQPSHLLSCSSHPVFNLSQCQGFFKWVSSLHQVTKVLELQLQHQSFQWIVRTASISMQSKGLARVFSNTTVQKHQFFCAQLSLWPISHIRTWLLEKP